jgi:queuine tRNA-ribosyltransferase
MGVLYEVRKQNFLSQRGPFRHAQDKPYPESEKNLFSSPPYEIDITQSIYKNNLEPVDVNCDCYTCSNFAKSYLHHLFKQREILGYTLATIHNLWTMERLFEKIREMIGNNLI